MHIPKLKKNHICVNNGYYDFVSKILRAIGSVSLIRTIRVKSNIKPWFDNDD